MPIIPTSQSQRIREIQDIFWRSLDESLDELDDLIAQRARLSMAKIRASGYSKSVIRRETKKITSATNGSTERLLASQIEAAALYAQRAADVIRAWQISGRLRDGVEHLTVSDSALARARLPGASAIDAEASLARIKIAPLRSQAEIDKALLEYGSKKAVQRQGTVSTPGTRAMAKLRKARLVRSSPEIGLSARLHGSAALNVDLTNNAVSTAIREASNMNKAGRDIVNLLNSEGSQLSVNRKLTTPLMRLKRAGRKLQLLSVNKADPDALKAATEAYNKEFAKIRKIAASRVDARGGYIELVQKVQKGVTRSYRGLGVKKKAFQEATEAQIGRWVAKRQAELTDKALTRWLDEKQAYHAERISETETAGAYRAREYQQHANKLYIVGFWWRRNPGMLSLDRKRQKDIFRVRRSRRAGRKAKRRTKGAPCRVCPSLADLRFPVEYARDYPRGAHPHCRCWYEWIYDTSRRDAMPITQGDLDWYESLPD